MKRLSKIIAIVELVTWLGNRTGLPSRELQNTDLITTARVTLIPIHTDTIQCFFVNSKSYFA